MSTSTLVDALLKELQPGETLLLTGTKVRMSKTAVALIVLLFVAVGLAVFVHNTLLSVVTFVLVTAGFVIRITGLNLKRQSGPKTFYAVTDVRVFEVKEEGIKTLAKHNEIEKIADRSEFKFKYKVVSFKNGIAPIQMEEFPPNYGPAMLISEKTERLNMEREQGV